VGVQRQTDGLYVTYNLSKNRQKIDTFEKHTWMVSNGEIGVIIEHNVTRKNSKP
jgi:hypothetical protein